MKLNQSTDTKIYFWGCTHIFHDPNWEIPIWNSRGYKSVDEHAESIRYKINSTCSQSDILIHLGDGFLNSSPEKVESYLNSLNTNIYYIWGNHESSTYKLYLKYKKEKYPDISAEIYPLKHNNITFLGNYKELVIDNTYVILQHFPLKVWNNSKKGSIHIHSHNHGGLTSSLPFAQEGKILDVGVEVFPDEPVSFNDVMKIMNNKEIKKFDNHH